jgi:hypothetical protein
MPCPTSCAAMSTKGLDLLASSIVKIAFAPSTQFCIHIYLVTCYSSRGMIGWSLLLGSESSRCIGPKQPSWVCTSGCVWLSCAIILYETSFCLDACKYQSSMTNTWTLHQVIPTRDGSSKSCMRETRTDGLKWMEGCSKNVQARQPNKRSVHHFVLDYESNGLVWATNHTPMVLELPSFPREPKS